MTARRQPKPTATEELARVLTIYDMLDEELRRRPAHDSTKASPDSKLNAFMDGSLAMLTIADRIAARTEGL